MAAAVGGDCPEREPDAPGKRLGEGGTAGECAEDVAPGSLLVASPCLSFRSIFRRYFTAAGYNVEVLQSPYLVARHLATDRESPLLVLDLELLSSAEAEGWRRVLGDAKAAGVPVRPLGGRAGTLIGKSERI